jgi:BirA family biotin operon repressor/biotin-[acetyl-CoA-carboxylase] ligase
MIPELTQLTLSWLKANEFEFTHFEEVNSTSSWAKETALKSDRSFRLILSDRQSQGRGRNTHTWINSKNPGDSLLSTWCFRTRHSPQPILTPRLGLGLWQALKKIYWELPLSIKAPNDLFLDKNKLAGLLVEVVEQGSQKEILIGLGLNVLSSPENMMAAHLNQKLSIPLILKNWPDFLSELKKQFEFICNSPENRLSPTEISKLLNALNQNPNLVTPYSQLEPDGTLWQSEKRIPWNEL